MGLTSFHVSTSSTTLGIVFATSLEVIGAELDVVAPGIPRSPLVTGTTAGLGCVTTGLPLGPNASSDCLIFFAASFLAF